MSRLYDYSKWDNLVVSDESISDDPDIGVHEHYVHKNQRNFDLLYNRIIPLKQNWQFDSDSMNDSDFEFSEETNKPFIDMSFKKYSSIRMNNNWDYKMEKSRLNQIVCENEMKRLTNLHVKYIKTNNTILQCDYILYIYLQGIRPKIWREIRVPSTISLAAFHDKILTPLFGWKRNFHSYLFLEQKRIDKRISYGHSSQAADQSHIGAEGNMWYELGSIVVSSERVYLCDVIDQNIDTLRYVYDLGDMYFHKIILKQIIPRNNNDINVVEVIDGERGFLLENTKGNRGFVERLTKLKDINVEQKEFEETILEFINAPNFPCIKRKKHYDIERFDVSSMNKIIKKYLSKILTTQDALCMMRFPYGKYCYQRELAKSYKKGQDYEDSKQFQEELRGARFCNFCNEYDKKYSARPRSKKYGCCMGCLSVFYCSRKCQKKDWNKQHRYFCFNHSNFH